MLGDVFGERTYSQGPVCLESVLVPRGLRPSMSCPVRGLFERNVMTWVSLAKRPN